MLGVYEADCEKNAWKSVFPKQLTFRPFWNMNIEEVLSASNGPVSVLRQLAAGLRLFESIVKHFSFKAVHKEQSPRQGWRPKACGVSDLNGEPPHAVKR